MARTDALLRITKTLVNRRHELRKRLGVDMDDLGVKTLTTSGDPADAAFDHTGEELASHLAELESKELAQIERAISRIKQGKYGVCDGCSCKIPVMRLNALPYSTLCIKCQRENEGHAGWLEDRMATDWANVRDAGADDREIDISAIEMGYSK